MTDYTPLRQDLKFPLFEERDYYIRLELSEDGDGKVPTSLAAATWIACAITDHRNPADVIVEKSLLDGVTIVDAAGGIADAAFDEVDTASILKARQASRTLRYEWSVVIGGVSRTPVWGYLTALPTGAT